MNKYLALREQKIFIVSVLTVAAALFYNGLYLPLRGKKVALEEEIALQRKMLESELKVITKARGIQARYDYFNRAYQKSGSMEEAASSVLSEVERVAAKIGLQVADLKPDKVKEEEFGHYYSVSLTVNSGLIDILRFLYTLQQPPHSIDVTALDFEQTARRGQSKIVTRLRLGKLFTPSEESEKVSHYGRNEPVL